MFMIFDSCKYWPNAMEQERLQETLCLQVLGVVVVFVCRNGFLHVCLYVADVDMRVLQCEAGHTLI